jgi:hypothetical protein
VTMDLADEVRRRYVEADEVPESILRVLGSECSAVIGTNPNREFWEIAT